MSGPQNNIILYNAQTGKVKFLNKVPKLVPQKLGKDSDKWIRFGLNNDYPQQLLSIIDLSPNTKAAIDIYHRFLAGEGFMFRENDQVYRQYLKKANETESWDAVFTKCCRDFTEIGSLSMVLKPNLVGEVQSVEHLPSSYVRLSKARANNVSEWAYVSENWLEEKKQPEYRAKVYPVLNLAYYKQNPQRYCILMMDAWAGITGLDFDDFPGFLFYYKEYQQSAPYYGKAAWESAFNSAYIDGQIQVFHANNLDNGFNPTVIIYYPGDLNGKDQQGRDKKTAIKEDLEKHFQGAENAGKPFNVFGKDKDSAPQVMAVPNNTNHDLFITLDTQVQSKIARSMGIPPVLVGILTAGKLGTSQEIFEATQLFLSTVIKPIQNSLVEIFAPLIAAKAPDEPTKKAIKDNLTISNLNPVAYIPPQFAAAFTNDEIREGFGFPPIDQDQKDQWIKVREALSTLSPLIANKVLGSMTPDEVRALVGIAELTEEQKKELEALSAPEQPIITSA